MTLRNINDLVDKIIIETIAQKARYEQIQEHNNNLLQENNSLKQ